MQNGKTVRYGARRVDYRAWLALDRDARADAALVARDRAIAACQTMAPTARSPAHPERAALREAAVEQQQ